MRKLIKLLANEHLKNYYDDFSNIFVRKFKIIWENLKFCGKIQLIELLAKWTFKKILWRRLKFKILWENLKFRLSPWLGLVRIGCSYLLGWKSHRLNILFQRLIKVSLSGFTPRRKAYFLNQLAYNIIWYLASWVLNIWYSTIWETFEQTDQCALRSNSQDKFTSSAFTVIFSVRPIFHSFCLKQVCVLAFCLFS